MPDLPASSVEIRDFPGLVLDTDPHDTPPGASRDQVNVTCEKAGELVSRQGYQPVSFES